MSEIKRLLPLAGANCINVIALGINIPLLSFFVVALGGSEFEAVVIFTVFSAAAFMTAPLWGRLSDHIGRKTAILISLGLTILSYLWLAGSESLWEIFASRVLAGLSSGWMSIPLAFVGDVTGKENRARGMGLIGAGFGVGFTIGPLLQALMVGERSAPEFQVPILAAAAIALCGFIIVLLLVKEPGRHGVDKRQPVARVFSDKTVLFLLIIYFSVFLIWTGVEGIFALWSLRKFGLGPSDVGYFLGVGGIVMALVQGGLIGRLVGKYGEVRIVVAGLCFFIAGLLVLVLGKEVWVIYLAMALYGLAMGLYTPAMQSLFSRSAPADCQGAVMGAAQSASSLARVIGPTVSVLIFAGFGYDMPYLVGAVCLVSVMMVFCIMSHRSNARATGLN